MILRAAAIGKRADARPKKPLPRSHLPGIAQKLPNAELHVLDYQCPQARWAGGKTPARALFIMHKGAQACITAENSVPQGGKASPPSIFSGALEYIELSAKRRKNRKKSCVYAPFAHFRGYSVSQNHRNLP
jgi:hypothetical protein